MSINTFIPEVWASRLLFALETAHVFAQSNVANRDYEGDISAAGDTVRIQSIGEVAISSYTKNTNISAPETLSDAEATLLIDQAKYFNFQVDDVDKRQGKPGAMDAAIRRAGFRLRDTVDALIAGFYTSAGSAVASSGSPKTDLGTAGKAYTYLVDLSVLLDEADVPAEDRWVAPPPWYIGELLKDDRFVGAGDIAGAARLLNGQVGEAAGFAILKSNNCSNDATTWRVMAGTPMAFLDHTQSSMHWFSYTLNGVEYGEIGQGAFYAGAYGVPLVFCAGDRAACEEAARQFPGVVTAEVKWAVRRNAAHCLSGDVARKRSRDGVAEALGKLDAFKPAKLKMPITVELTLYRTDMIDDYMSRRGIERVGGRTIRMIVDDQKDILRF